MKLFFATLLITTTSLFAGECELRLYKLDCEYSPVGYACMFSLFQGPTEKLTTNLDLQSCFQKAVEMKNENDLKEEHEARKAHQETKLFDRVEMKYRGDEGKIRAVIKR